MLGLVSRVVIVHVIRVACGWDLGSAKGFFLREKKLFSIISERKVSMWSATSWSESSSPCNNAYDGRAGNPTRVIGVTL